MKELEIFFGITNIVIWMYIPPKYNKYKKIYSLITLGGMAIKLKLWRIYL